MPRSARALRSLRRLGPLAEAVLLVAVTLPLAVRFHLPTLWFVVPFAVVTLADRPYARYGLTWREPGSLRFHVVVVTLVFGLYAAGFIALGTLLQARHFTPTLPPRFLRRAFEQFVLVGLSEEFFFRGYFQTQCNRVFGRPYRLLGARWGPGLPLAALVFGACHLVTGDLSRMRVALFGLFVGWLRERTGTIAVPAAYHGAANLLYEFLTSSLR